MLKNLFKATIFYHDTHNQETTLEKRKADYKASLSFLSKTGYFTLAGALALARS